MDIDEFWLFLQRSRQMTSDPDERLRWLTLHLAQRPPARIVDFQILLTQVRRRSDTYDMWEAANLVCGGCSTDGFWYFQAWLIGLGRDIFERVVADPDNLAEVPEVQRLAERPMGGWADDEWPRWEALSYVAAGAAKRRPVRRTASTTPWRNEGTPTRAIPSPQGFRGGYATPKRVAPVEPHISTR